jgi:hypothetical protein
MWSETEREYILTERWVPKKMQGKNPPLTKRVVARVVNGQRDIPADSTWSINAFATELKHSAQLLLPDVTANIVELMVVDNSFAKEPGWPILLRDDERGLKTKLSISLDEAEKLQKVFVIRITKDRCASDYGDYDSDDLEYSSGNIGEHVHGARISAEVCDSLPKTMEEAKAIAARELLRLCNEWDEAAKEQYEAQLQKHNAIRRAVLAQDTRGQG